VLNSKGEKMNISWVKDPFSSERVEFERVANDFSEDPGSLKTNIMAIRKLYEKATLQTLTKNTWSSLENTDSWDTTTIAKIQSAIKQNAGSSGSRNIENVLKEFLIGSVRAPIILQYDEGKSYTLIAGNTRLMVARMLDIPVKVVIIKSDW
jgi:hypothetical protein